jgi:hypothetical protein
MAIIVCQAALLFRRFLDLAGAAPSAQTGVANTACGSAAMEDSSSDSGFWACFMDSAISHEIVWCQTAEYAAAGFQADQPPQSASAIP